MTYGWQYLRLVNGRLVDNNTGADANPNWPYFQSEQEAETWLAQQDVRATVISAAVELVRPRWSPHIMDKVRQWKGLSGWDTSKDAEIDEMSRNEVFDACLEWEGIIGYGSTIRGWIEDIYGVPLSAL